MVRIKLRHKGSLKKLGYKVHESEQLRHIALIKAINKYGKLEVERKLLAQIVLRKYATGAKLRAKRIFVKDFNYIRENF